METIEQLLSADGVSVVYDGDCPFCSRYVALTRLRDTVGEVRLIDARRSVDLGRALMREGYDLNEGMAVFFAGEIHYGGEAMRTLALLSERRGIVAPLMRLAMGGRRRARLLYPMLRAGRNLTLRILGRPPLQTGEQETSDTPRRAGPERSS